MATLTEARAALATALGAETYVPEVIDPPCNVIEPGDPYLEHPEHFGHAEYVANVDVYVLVPADDNAAMADQLDAALLAACDAIEGIGWSVEQIGKPGSFFTADWLAYGVKITAATRVSRP